MFKMVKKYNEYLIPLLVSIAIILLYLIFNRFDINDSFMINDLESQYVGLIQYLKNALMGKDSLFYSFSKGIGGNMISTLSYYLISPFNIFVLFFKNINVGIAIGILLRFCFCNLTAYVYLKNKYQTTKINKVIFSTIYAFSGFMINYYFNIMWLDILILLPLILLQIDRLIDKNKSITLIILIAISLMINFYFSYMLVIFIYIYTLYELTLKNVDKNYMIKIFIEISIYILIGALLASVIMLPTIIDMKNNLFRYPLNINLFNIDLSKIKMLISKLYIGSIDDYTRFSPHHANIYFTIFGLVLTIKYFFNSKITKKEKIISFLVILIFILSILFDFLNIIWHGFSYPNGYNYRFIFLFILFLINIIIKQYINNEELSKNKIIFMNLIFVAISFFMMGEYSYLTNNKIILSVIFFLIYTILLNKKNNKLLLIIVLLEIFINFDYSLLTREKLNYTHMVNSDYISDVCELAKTSDQRYRVSLEQINYANDPFSCNIKDVSLSLSTNNKLVYKFMSNVGYPVTYSTIMKNFYVGPFINSILGIKEIIQYQEYYEDYYKLESLNQITSDSYFLIYENTNALQIGYVIEKDNFIYNNNPFENQNNLAKKMSGIDLDIFEKVELTKISDNEYSFEGNKKNYYFYNYFEIPINQNHYMSVYLNGKKMLDIHSFNKGIHKITDIKENNILKLVSNEDLNPRVYTFNEENYQTIINKLKLKQLNVLSFEENKLTGSINLSDDETLMLSLPYEKGWRVKVNGKLVNYKKVYDTFIGIDLYKGENNIELIFIPPGIILGLILSIIGSILAYLYSKTFITRE